MFIIVCLALFSVIECCRVELSYGVIEGEQRTVGYSPFENQTGLQFLGIPFAAPPIGDLRFERPRNPYYLTGIRKTKKYGPACMSDKNKTFKREPFGTVSEDCLYLNVFTNEFCMRTRNCSVMLVVHGGGSLTGSASAFDGDIMINNFVGQGRNIIVVTVNYRMGVFGFPNFPGVESNLALYDILESIHWCHREIHAFGGNARRLTLAGHSAGGSLVAQLTLSPLTRGLIHQQVLMSPPLFDRPQMANRQFSEKVSMMLGCGKGNVGCLRRFTDEQLFKAQEMVLKNTTIVFEALRVDGDIVPDVFNTILEKSQSSIHKVSTMIGTTSGELRDSTFLRNEQRNVYLDRLEYICDHLAFQYSFVNQSEFKNRCVEKYQKRGKAELLSDDFIFYSTTRKLAASQTSPTTNVFMYSYKYKGAGAAFAKYQKTIESPTHSEDLIYVFGTHRVPEKMTRKDYEIERIYSGIFADFVNFGKPRDELKWQQFNEPEGHYFEIDFEDENLEMPGMKMDYHREAHQFWNVEVVRDFEKVYLPKLSKSVNSFIIDDRLRALKSHVEHKPATDAKPLEIWEQLYNEFGAFQAELKHAPKPKSGPVQIPGMSLFDVFFYVYLGVIGCSIVVIALHQTYIYYYYVPQDFVVLT